MTSNIRPALCAAALLLSAQTNAHRPELAIDTEYYHETYREYINGSEPFMQQRGNLWGLSVSIGLPISAHQKIQLESRYSQGKSDYTGGYNPNDTHPQGTPFGSLNIADSPRKSYAVHAAYRHTRPLKHGLSAVASGGIGYRILKDKSGHAHPDGYDRENRSLYASVGAGLEIKLPHTIKLKPEITYNHLLQGNQYSYYSDKAVRNKQPKGHGIEASFSLSKRLSENSEISITPFYRGWRIKDSAETETTETDGTTRIFIEPKNQTHETGLRLHYRF